MLSWTTTHLPLKPTLGKSAHTPGAGVDPELEPGAGRIAGLRGSDQDRGARALRVVAGDADPAVGEGVVERLRVERAAAAVHRRPEGVERDGGRERRAASVLEPHLAVEAHHQVARPDGAVRVGRDDRVGVGQADEAPGQARRRRERNRRERGRAPLTAQRVGHRALAVGRAAAGDVNEARRHGQPKDGRRRGQRAHVDDGALVGQAGDARDRLVFLCGHRRDERGRRQPRRHENESSPHARCPPQAALG